MIGMLYKEETEILPGYSDDLLLPAYYIDQQVEESIFKEKNYFNLLSIRSDVMDFSGADDFLSFICRSKICNIIDLLPSKEITKEMGHILRSLNDNITRFIVTDVFLSEHRDIDSLNNDDPTLEDAGIKSHASSMIEVIKRTPLVNSYDFTNELILYYKDYEEYLYEFKEGVIDELLERNDCYKPLNLTRSSSILDNGTTSHFEYGLNLLLNHEEFLMAYYLDKVDIYPYKNHLFQSVIDVKIKLITRKK